MKRLLCTSSVSTLALAVLSLVQFDNGVAAFQQVTVDEIIVSVAVTTKDGTPVSNLSKNAFQVFEDKNPAPITLFLDQSAPTSIAVVFDLSGSVGGLKGPKPKQRLIAAVEKIAQLIDVGNGSNEYFIIAFSNGHQLLASGVREDVKPAIDRLRSFSASGQSEFFDTCRFAIDQVAKGKHSKKAVLLISDGEDTYSHLELEDIRRSLKETGVVIYALDIGDTQDSSYLSPKSGSKVLDKLSDDSGGLALHPKKPDDVAAALEHIAENLNTRYVVGFKPAKIRGAGSCYPFKVALAPSLETTVKAGMPSVRSRQNHCPVSR